MRHQCGRPRSDSGRAAFKEHDDMGIFAVLGIMVLAGIIALLIGYAMLKFILFTFILETRLRDRMDPREDEDEDPGEEGGSL